MKTLHHYYNESDEFGSSLSISVALIIFSLIMGLGYKYGPDARHSSAETSLQENFNVVEVKSATYLSPYAESGSLSY